MSPLSQVARQLLLRPGAPFIPGKLRVHAALASIRTTAVSCFDLRAFNAFRSNDSLFYDIEHVLAAEPGCGVLLSSPKLVFEFGISGHRSPPLHKKKKLELQASVDGVLNCVCHWAELELLPGARRDGVTT